jgi:hypothetical protein
MEHLALLTLHHIVCDGWSMQVLVGELKVLYESFVAERPSPLPDLAFQYSDYAQSQRASLEDDESTSVMAYWRRKLELPLAPQDLPTDRPRPLALTFSTAHHPVSVAAALTAALRRLAHDERCSLFMVVLAALNILLYRLIALPDIRVATQVANRGRPELQRLIGLFANTVILRTDLAGDPTFRELLRRVRETALEAYANEAMPMEILVDHLDVPSDFDEGSLYRVAFYWENIPVVPLQFGDVHGELWTRAAGLDELDLTLTTCDLVLSLAEDQDAITGKIVYKTDLFDASTIERLRSSFLTILSSAIAQPEARLSQFDLAGSAFGGPPGAAPGPRLRPGPARPA